MYNITKFFKMDLKIFLDTNMLLKVDCFEGISNWSKIDAFDDQ